MHHCMIIILNLYKEQLVTNLTSVGTIMRFSNIMNIQYLEKIESAKCLTFKLFSSVPYFFLRYDINVTLVLNGTSLNK